MDINDFLCKYFNRLSGDDISDINHFTTYDNFKQFILDHYQLDHVEKNNYIKYVKIKRQMLKLIDWGKYTKYINKINSIIEIMTYNHVFSHFDIKKYMYKMNVFFKLVENKKNSLKKTINIVVYPARNKYMT